MTRCHLRVTPAELTFAVRIICAAAGMQPYRHLSDLRTTLLLRSRSSVAGSDALARAEACASALRQATRLLGEHGGLAHVRELLAQARALLDELDETLLVLAHDEDRAVFAQLELLRATLNELDSRQRRGRAEV